MSGIIAVYGLVVAVLVAGSMKPPSSGSTYSLFQGFMHLACGLSVGLSGVAAGYAIGAAGNAVCCKSSPEFLELRAYNLSRAFVHSCNSREYSSEWCSS